MWFVLCSHSFRKGCPSASVGVLILTALSSTHHLCLGLSGVRTAPGVAVFPRALYISLTMLCHALTILRAMPEWAVEGDEMSENGEPVAMVAASSAAAPSCYRVSLLSGSLEVSARLKSADDLELLMRVLEANKVLFTKGDTLGPEILAKADRPATKLSTSQSETRALAKTDRSKAKSSTKANGSASKFLTEVDQSEDEIFTLT